MAGPLAGEQTVSERSDSESKNNIWIWRKMYEMMGRLQRHSCRHIATMLLLLLRIIIIIIMNIICDIKSSRQQAAEWIKLKPGQVCWLMICSKYLRIQESLWMGKCSIYVHACVSSPSQISGIWSVKLLSTFRIMTLLLALLRRCCSFSWLTWGVTWFVGHAVDEFGYPGWKNAHIL